MKIRTKLALLALLGLLIGGVIVYSGSNMATHSHNTSPPLHQTFKDFGVIVLAHGGNAQWNAEVTRVCCASLSEQYPTVVAFGMAHAAEIQRAIDTLEALGVKKIAVVPLYISSHSELWRQTEFVLGIRKEPDPDFVEGMRRAKANVWKFISKKISFTIRELSQVLASARSHVSMKLDQQVKSRVPLTLLYALNDSHFVGEILAERAKEMSSEPQRESVVIVGHGPINDADDAKWLADMEKLAVFVRRIGFRDIRVATIRDDAPDAIKDLAVKRLQTIVRTRAIEGDRVLVVPLLLSRGGVEKEIHHILKGLPYAYNEQTLLPHGNIGRWLEGAVQDYMMLTNPVRAENLSVIARMQKVFAVPPVSLNAQP